MEIIDNFLDQNEFDELQKLILLNVRDKFSYPPPDMPPFAWYYNDSIVGGRHYKQDINKFQFTHMFYVDDQPQSAFYFSLIPILKKLDATSIMRVKANLLTRTSEIVQNAFHVDLDGIPEEKMKQCTTSIFYMNTNNGYTKFEDGTIVESVANRMVTFPADMPHTGSSCTDDKIRVVINFNYFK